MKFTNFAISFYLLIKLHNCESLRIGCSIKHSETKFTSTKSSLFQFTWVVRFWISSHNLVLVWWSLTNVWNHNNLKFKVSGKNEICWFKTLNAWCNSYFLPVEGDKTHSMRNLTSLLLTFHCHVSFWVKLIGFLI